MHSQLIGKKIAELRKAKSLTQNELALASKLNIRSIQRLERGDVVARAYTLKAIAKALDVDINEFIDMDTPIQKDYSKFWIAALHVSSIMPIVLIGFLIWIFKRDEIPDFDKHAKAVLNFQISFCIYLFAASMLIFVVIGFLVLPIMGVFITAISIINAIKASMDQDFKYPFCIEFIK